MAHGFAQQLFHMNHLHLFLLLAPFIMAYTSMAHGSWLMAFLKENREIGIEMKETPAVGIEMKCACKRYRFGKRLPLAYPKTKKINTNLAELMGCVATLNYFREFFPSLKATLYCDNSGTCDLVKKGFANDPNFNVHVKKIISLKLSSDISGPFHRDRKETYAADSIAFVGEEYYADMRAMEVFLENVHKITVMIEGSVDRAVDVLSPYEMIYLRYEHLLRDSAVRLNKPDLVVVAVVAAYISTVASHVGDTVNPNGFQSFERYLLKCSRGNASLSGMLAWYKPARYLIETAQKPLQPKVAQRVATFERNCDELVRLLKALPSEDGGGDANSGGDANEQSLRHVEHDNAKILNSEGELSEDNASSFEKLWKFYDNLYRGVSSLAEALDMQPPVMPEDGHTTRVTCGDDSASSASGKESSTVEPVWDNEVTRAFYECLPDLRAFVPAALLGESESKGNEPAKEAVARIEELKKTIEAKMTLRQSNLKPERPDPSFLRTLDSSIKRNTAVIKKLKQITEEQREGLMDELRGINMSKFVTEAVVVICDAKIRSSDIPAAVQICSFLHQRYPDFSSSLSQGLLKVFFPGKVAEDLETDRNSKAMRKRNTLKLLLELYFVGVIEDSSIFVNIIKDLASAEHMKDRDTTLTNLSLLATFARQGRVFLGLPLSGPELTDELFKDLSITADQKKIIKKVLYGYYDTMAEVLQAEHASLRHVEHDNAKILNSKGELSDDNASSYEKLRKSYDNLYRGVSSLAEALDMQPPVMPEDGHTTRVTSGDDSASSTSGKESSTVEPVWDDEDTRAFYECLPDLRAFVPAVLLGESESKGNEPAKDAATESEHSQAATEDIVEPSSDSGAVLDEKVNEKGKEKDGKGKEKDVIEKNKDSEKEKGKDKDTDKKGDKDKEKKGLDSTNLDTLLQRLPGCVSRDLIDQLTVEFCYLNSKSSRKKLVRALFNVPRTSLELLPYYSRMVATLSTCMKDISTMLLQLLEEEFNFLTNKKDQMNIETKIRNIRFIGELCKFKIAPAGLVFSCLKACLDDFSHHSIDVACNLLETCGRFLYRSPETSVRMANMLEILMRLKNVKNLDPRHSTLVENAYYLCKPPERPARISKVRPPLHQYIRKLLFSDLDKSSIEHVLRQLRKLPWSECEPYLLKCFLKVHRGKYGQIHLIASLAACLSCYHENFAVAVVDEVLEEIRLGLELNDYAMQQQRLAHMRFLGELYNYAHADSSVIFETLYLILVFGHGTAEQDVLDPPEDCFRIRLVMTLLETCGHYFGRGSSRRKLDRFLIHFQRYTLSKGVLPLDIEFDLQDLFAHLRPNMTRYTSIEEVNAALAELDEHDVKASNESSNNITQTSLANGQQSPTNGVDRNGGVHDVTGDSDTDTGGSGSIGAGAHEDDDELDDENHEAGSEAEDDDDEDDDEEVGPASDEDGELHFRQKAPIVDPKEEDEFDRELKALMQESLESRKLELRNRPTLDMMIPMNIFESSSKDHHGRVVEGESGSDTFDEENGGNREVRVKVLVKRGHKQQTKQMLIPQECSLVRTTKQKEAAELEEKQDIKRLVLEYNDREEEELNGINNQVTGFTQGGIGRFSGRGSTWDGSGGRHSGSRPRFHHHSGGGYYYGRRR